MQLRALPARVRVGSMEAERATVLHAAGQEMRGERRHTRKTILHDARNGTHASIHTRPHSDYHVAHSDHSQWYMKMTIYRIYSLSRHDRSLIIEAVLYSIHTRVGFHTRRVLLCSFPLLRCEVVGA